MKKYLILAAFILALYIGIIIFRSDEVNGMENRMKAVTKAAIASHNITQCDELPEHFEKTVHPRSDEEDGKGDTRGSTISLYPRSSCLNEYVRSTNDKTACDKIAKVGRDSCYKYLAEVYSDPSWCDKLDHNDPAYWRTSVMCRAIATLDPKECAPFDTPRLNPPQFGYSPKTDCISEIAVRTHNYKECLTINLPGYMESDAKSSRNGCLQAAACDQPEVKKEACSLIQYDEFTPPEKKSLCIEEQWKCPTFIQRITQ